METVDAETLLNTNLPEKHFLISGLLPQGLHILGGAPKTGKSWLVLWLCLQIAKGESVWNRETRQGTVLYLALEDSYNRIQSRLLEMTDEAPNCLHLSILSKTLEDGLTEQLEEFLASHPDTLLVAIDTLQMVRTGESRANLYASDYADLRILKQFADQHSIAVLLVHHLRKMRDDDPLNMLSGTSGISGAADGSYILDRDDRTKAWATLFCTGRDIESVNLPLAFSEETYSWQLREDTGEMIPLLNPVVSLIDNYFHTAGLKSFQGTATDLAGKIEAAIGEKTNPAVLTKKLKQACTALEQRGYILKTKRASYAKTIEITYVGDGSDGKTPAASGGEIPVMPSPERTVRPP